MKIAKTLVLLGVVAALGACTTPNCSRYGSETAGYGNRCADAPVRNAEPVMNNSIVK